VTTPAVARAILAIRAVPWRGIELVRPPDDEKSEPRRGRRGPTAAPRPLGETSTKLYAWLRANPGEHRTRVLADAVGENSRRICAAMETLVGRGLVARRPAGKAGGAGRTGMVYRALGLALVVGLLSSPARAQQMACAPLSRVIAGFAERFHEKPVSAGLQVNGQLFEIFASPDGATWTALTISPAGIACMVASGKNWQQGEPGEPS
jgi:hypothetical protein